MNIYLSIRSSNQKFSKDTEDSDNIKWLLRMQQCPTPQKEEESEYSC